MKLSLCAPLRAACAGLLMCLATGCAPRSTTTRPVPATAGPGRVEGTASFREQVTLSADATFEALLLDVSRLDAPGTAISRTVIVSPSSQPIAFSIAFDSSLIDDRRRYAVRGRLLVNGRPTWVSEQAQRVLTQGAGRSVSLVMRRQGAAEQLTDSVVRLSGEVTYLADVATVLECSSRRVFPVSTEGEFPEFRRVYSEQASLPGKPLYVTFDGAIVLRQQPTGTGMSATVIVSDVVDAWPNLSCAKAADDSPLLDTRWRIAVLDGIRVSAIPGRSEPHLFLQRAGGSVTYSATVGCNGIGGNATIVGDSIDFGTGTGTLMACGSPLDSLERRLTDVLQRAAEWEILGRTLEIRDDAAVRLALFEAVTSP